MGDHETGPRDFQHEREFVLATVDNDASVLDGVRPRPPDVVFDDYLRLDLGGRVVEIHRVIGSPRPA